MTILERSVWSAQREEINRSMLSADHHSSDERTAVVDGVTSTKSALR